jgi:5-methyltetrahydropteroyltriglutamate--homocysteine methyltransferase
MKRSNERMLTTHTGSLPRTPALTKLLIAREQKREYDPADMAREARTALDIVLQKQIAAGIDIGNDGEMPRIGFSTYVAERISGFGGESERRRPTDMDKFPEFAEFFVRHLGATDNLAKVWNAPEALEELHYDDTLSGARGECALFADGLAACDGGFAETFMTAASPGIVTTTLLRAENNKAYANDREYVLAVAKELKKEYDYVVSQGHILQLDAPDLAMERVIMFGERPLGEFLERVELHIEAMNIALADVPPEKVRLHVCWGNWQGPHIDDVPVKELLPILYQANVGALSIPLGNPRHEHEFIAFRDLPLPDGMVLIPGVIDVTTNYLEHPEVVANRICNVVEAVGDKTRVIAGTDCGFGTFASFEFVAQDVVWAKLGALADGAKIASQRLWG